MRIEWSPWALADRDANFDHVEAENPRAAIALDERISERIQALIRFPESGRVGRVDGTRELVIGSTPSIAAYRVTGDAVGILRVPHGSQRWPDDL